MSPPSAPRASSPSSLSSPPSGPRLFLPPIPDAAIRTSGKSYLRYDDVCQDGRLSLAALSPPVSAVVWRELVRQRELSFYRALYAQGVIPIMNRGVLVGASGRIPVTATLDGEGAVHLAHVADDAGEPVRLLMRIWMSVSAPGPDDDDDGDATPAGSAYIEHVFTRLFAPPGQRKVVRFDVPGLPAVPPDRVDWRPPAAVLALPPGASPVGEARADAAPVAFGLRHTDSNQHVNSMVYPCLFEDAALRRMAEHGRATAVLARGGEIAYRKPCFAGEQVRVVLRLYERDGALGAVGCFVDAARAADAEARFPAVDDARCYVHMTFEP